MKVYSVITVLSILKNVPFSFNTSECYTVLRFIKKCLIRRGFWASFRAVYQYIYHQNWSDWIYFRKESPKIINYRWRYVETLESNSRATVDSQMLGGVQSGSWSHRSAAPAEPWPSLLSLSARRVSSQRSTISTLVIGLVHLSESRFILHCRPLQIWRRINIVLPMPFLVCLSAKRVYHVSRCPGGVPREPSVCACVRVCRYSSLRNVATKTNNKRMMNLNFCLLFNLKDRMFDIVARQFSSAIFGFSLAGAQAQEI